MSNINKKRWVKCLPPVIVNGGLSKIENKNKIKITSKKKLGGLSKMRKYDDLEAGKLDCVCLIHKWKFCKTMKEIAGEKINKNLLELKCKKTLQVWST